MMGENIIFAQTVSEVNSAVHYSVLADETISQKKSDIKLRTIQFTDCLPHMYVTRSRLYPCRALHLYSTTDADTQQTQHSLKLSIKGNHGE